jgi:predicted RNA-binding protein with PIN domain
MMRRRYLVDGYNLLHQLPEQRRQLEYNLEAARDGLLVRLSAFSISKSMEVTVVFDGIDESGPPPRKWKGLVVHFSKPPQKADPVIKKMISDRKRNEELVVVTSDRDIDSYARLCGVKVETSQSFAAALIRNPSSDIEKKNDHPISKNELDEWMRLFGQKPSGKIGGGNDAV